VGSKLCQLILVLGLAGWLSACGSSEPPPTRPVVSDPVAACLQSLDQHHVVYDRVKDWGTAEGCGIQGAIRVKKDLTDWSRATLMACGLENSLYDFESRVLQPVAQKHFHQNVKRILNMGAYNCRNEKSEHADRLSQHALGKAIDVSGFELEDGTSLSVLKDWSGKGDRSDFLHEVAKGACGVFSVVITPNQNALHRDHIHMDIGPHKMCGS